MPTVIINKSSILTPPPEIYEPPAGDMDSISSCQAWAASLQAVGVEHFHFTVEEEECRLYSSLHSSCSAIGGPVVAPPIDDCQGGAS